MRVSPIGLAFDNLTRVEEEAGWSAEVTHNHPEGIKGAQAVAAAIFMARRGCNKEEITAYIAGRFGYDREVYRFHLGRSLKEIRPMWGRFESCQDTVPVAFTLFNESSDYDDCIRQAVILGGDTDTLACIAGGIAQAFYRFIPPSIIQGARQRLAPELLDTMDAFEQRYPL